MKQIKVRLVPNQENDIQTFSFEDLGITHFEWSKMNDGDKRMLVLENITENICSFIDSIDEL